MTKVFISYSHKDENWKDRLQTQLNVLQVAGRLSVWDDRQIETGSDWYPEIERALNEAQVAILLISADFLSSKFILGKEVPPLLERRKAEGIHVLPLIIRPCPWQKIGWLAAMQGAFNDNKALSGLSKHKSETVLIDSAQITLELLMIVPILG